MSIAPEIPDVDEPLAVERLDRAEIISQLRHLESLRSAWELRIRACEEREGLYKMFLKDMGAILAATFQAGHDSVDAHAQRAAALLEQAAAVMKRLEDI